MQNFVKTIVNAIRLLIDKKFKEAQNKIQNISNEIQNTVKQIQTNIEYVEITTNTKMDQNNPVGTGSFSMNRDSSSEIGEYSHAEGYEVEASGHSSHAEGSYTHASGEASHTEGSYTRAFEYCSHAEGNQSKATNKYSHAEGYLTTASGESSHAEGDSTLASGDQSHAEGYSTNATGQVAHAEGFATIASGQCSHVEGTFTEARAPYQHVQGKYNMVDTSKTYAHIVGNGTAQYKRSNAHTLDWNGNAWYQGEVYVGGKSQSDAKAVKLAKISDIPDVSGQIDSHNVSLSAHNDIRLLVDELTNRLNTLADSDDTTLDQMSELVEYIKSNKTLIEEITTKKVNVSDIINNLTTNVDNKPLSAAQGVVLKELIDAIKVPTKVSELTNDSGYLTEHQSLEGLATKEYVDNKTAIIDVVELPTENIDEKSWYRLITAKFLEGRMHADLYTVYCVETLPEVGKPASNLEMTDGNIYYVVGTGEPYGYVDETLSAGLSVPVGWYPGETLVGAFGNEYGGIVTSIDGIPEDDEKYRILVEYTHYSYKNNWNAIDIIGWRGTGEHAEIFNSFNNIASGYYSHAEGYETKASGSYSHAEGKLTYTQGDSSHAEGEMTYANGRASHAEGSHSHADGNYSHAEGSSTYAQGIYSHAEGDRTYAGEQGSHAEGLGDYIYTSITGEANSTLYTIEHVDGLIVGAAIRIRSDNPIASRIAKIIVIDTDNKIIEVDRTLSEEALVNEYALILNSGSFGYASHSEGKGTVAVGKSQHVQGEYNIVDPEYDVGEYYTRSKYAHIVGNGSEKGKRSNAHTLDWDGNAWYQGNIYVGGTGQDDTAAKKIATEEYVSDRIDNSVADWNQNDETALDYVKNRTHWSEHVTLLPETEFVYSPDVEAFVYEGNIEFVAGVNYTIVWNGVSYISVCTNESGVTIIGNAPAILGSGDTGEPFAIASGEGMVIAVPLDGSETVSVSISGERIEKIPEKYLPVYNFVNGSAVASIRSVGSLKECGEYVIGEYALAEGSDTKSSGSSSHAEGSNTTASGHASHAEGNNTTASGHASHAEGGNTTASDYYSHAEGGNTTASDYFSHAEGNNTTASGYASHAEGCDTTASGHASHAEGNNTTASGHASHAEGYNTLASGSCQHSQGKFNIEDTKEKYAHIVGNGTADDTRSNAHTLDWDGNAWYQGDIYIGGTSQDDAAAKKIATEEYVDNKIQSFGESFNKFILPPFDPIADEGKILKIVNGVPTWVAIPNAEEASF